MLYIKPFSHLRSSDAAIAGGKGASLGEMTHAGISVPPGFVVLSTAFNEFIRTTKLEIKIDKLLQNTNVQDSSYVEKTSKTIQQLIIKQPFPLSLEKIVTKEFKKLDATFVAVRSSATAEDGMDAAWAGQLDSYLNTTKESLLDNIKKCWASLFTARAIVYRFEKGLQKQYISVAVVVQKMVESEISGIAFSVHPVTQDKNQIIIEPGYGLGEAIVSGQITPDSYVVSKSYFMRHPELGSGSQKIPDRVRNDMILEKNISEQSRAIIRGKNGGTQWTDISTEKRGKQKLSTEQIHELSKIILRIEQHYGFPCDIEWAFEKGNFYIVQSRPITTLEKDPLTSSTQKDIAKIILAKNWEIRVQRPGFLQPKQLPLEGICQKIQLTQNISVFNKCNIWIKNANLYDLDIINDLMENTFEKAFKEKADWPIGMIKKIDALSVQKDKFVHLLNQKNWSKATIKEKVTAVERYAQLQKSIPQFYAFAVPLVNYCEKILKEQDEPSLKYAMQYKALDMDIMTKSLTQIKKCPKSKIDTTIKKHIEKFGWIKTNYGIIEPYTKQDIDHELESDIHVFHPLLSPKNHPLKYIIDGLQVGIYLRNHMKELMQQLWFAYEQLIPHLIKELGIPREDFLQLLCTEAINSLKNGELCISSDEVQQRHKGFITGTLDNKTIVMTGSDVDTIFNHFNTVKIDTGADIAGAIACPGIVTGTVRIIHTISEINRLERGDVLVTSMTTPDFIVGMKKAGAIVTDEGGLSCHAAIVARELHIPCVIGTKIATQVLKDGDIVEVDANKGVVKILPQQNTALTTITSLEWKKNWAGGWSVLSGHYLGYQYVKQLQEVLGISLEKTLLISHKGITSCYFIEEYKEKFGRHFAMQIQKNPALIQRWTTLLKKTTDAVINDIKQLKKQKITPQTFDTFIQTMFNYGVPHRILKVATDYLPQNIIQKYLPTLSETRVYAEPAYEETENYMKWIADKIGRQHHISPELVLAMTKDQFTTYLQKDTLPPTQQLEQQYEHSVLYISSTTNFLSSNTTIVQDIEKALQKELDKKEIKGHVAYKGNVRGKVRIILNAKNAISFKKGEVLVAEMTRPEYIPYIQQSIAFITDAGGLLSHAAITARELQKPCIIGTEIATKVLKDGDIVEVDANNGVVRIIET